MYGLRFPYEQWKLNALLGVLKVIVINGIDTSHMTETNNNNKYVALNFKIITIRDTKCALNYRLV